jgi:hypothetical protein
VPVAVTGAVATPAVTPEAVPDTDTVTFAIRYATKAVPKAFQTLSKDLLFAGIAAIAFLIAVAKLGPFIAINYFSAFTFALALPSAK